MPAWPGMPVWPTAELAQSRTISCQRRYCNSDGLGGSDPRRLGKDSPCYAPQRRGRSMALRVVPERSVWRDRRTEMDTDQQLATDPHSGHYVQVKRVSRPRSAECEAYRPPMSACGGATTTMMQQAPNRVWNRVWTSGVPMTGSLYACMSPHSVSPTTVCRGPAPRTASPIIMCPTPMSLSPSHSPVQMAHCEPAPLLVTGTHSQSRSPVGNRHDAERCEVVTMIPLADHSHSPVGHAPPVMFSRQDLAHSHSPVGCKRDTPAVIMPRPDSYSPTGHESPSRAILRSDFAAQSQTSGCLCATFPVVLTPAEMGGAHTEGLRFPWPVAGLQSQQQMMRSERIPGTPIASGQQGVSRGNIATHRKGRN